MPHFIFYDLTSAEQARRAALRGGMAGNAFLLEGLKLGRLLRKANFNPNQPRVPAGASDGGQWSGNRGGWLGNAAIPSNTAHQVRLYRVAQTGRPSGFRVDLFEEERRGGHAISDHVGKSSEYLLARVRNASLDILARGDQVEGLSIGSFSSLDAATKLINSTIAQNRDTVNRVISGDLSRAFVTARFDSITGHEAYAFTARSQPYMRETYGVGVEVRRDNAAGNGFRVLTAYPIR